MIKRVIAVSAAVLGMAAGAIAAANSAAAKPAVRAPRTFVATTAVAPTRLARYSTTTGRLLKYLTTPQPGGGVGEPELSADGRTIVFPRGQGSCAETIDTVPARGGTERVLIPMTGLGATATLPDPGASLSADGRYLLYSMTTCANLNHHAVYLRNLRTGRTVRLARRGPELLFAAAFIKHDRQVAYISYGPSHGELAVLNLRPLRLRFYAAPRGCRYGPLATPGTGRLLTGTLNCGRVVKIVTVSPSSFRITATLAVIRGRCQQAISVSSAQRDPKALLLEVTGCHDTERILTIRNGKTTVLLSGPSRRMPQAPVW
jgi:hypothetical protein